MHEDDKPREEYPEWARPLNVLTAIVIFVAIILAFTSR